MFTYGAYTEEGSIAVMDFTGADQTNPMASLQSSCAGIFQAEITIQTSVVTSETADLVADNLITFQNVTLKPGPNQDGKLIYESDYAHKAGSIKDGAANTIML